MLLFGHLEQYFISLSLKTFLAYCDLLFPLLSSLVLFERQVTVRESSFSYLLIGFKMEPHIGFYT